MEVKLFRTCEVGSQSADVSIFPHARNQQLDTHNAVLLPTNVSGDTIAVIGTGKLILHLINVLSLDAIGNVRFNKSIDSVPCEPLCVWQGPPWGMQGQ